MLEACPETDCTSGSSRQAALPECDNNSLRAARPQLQCCSRCCHIQSNQHNMGHRSIAQHGPSHLSSAHASSIHTLCLHMCVSMKLQHANKAVVCLGYVYVPQKVTKMDAGPLRFLGTLTSVTQGCSKRCTFYISKSKVCIALCRSRQYLISHSRHFQLLMAS